MQGKGGFLSEAEQHAAESAASGTEQLGASGAQQSAGMRQEYTHINYFLYKTFIILSITLSVLIYHNLKG